MTNSDSRHINAEFADRESDENNVPLLWGPNHHSQKPKPSMAADHELRSFGLSLKWCGLDHSSYAAKFISYLTFTFLTVFVPVVASAAIKLPADDPILFNNLVQLPVSALSAIAFFTLSRFFRRYSLRQLLLVDGLQDDSAYVRQGYAGQLDKAFRYIACILLPSFLVEVVHKIMVFSSARVAYVAAGGVPASSAALGLVLASWVYRSGMFLVVCVLFRLTCELQLLRLEGLRGVLSEGCESSMDAGEIFQEHMRIRKQLSVTSHRYRFFIIGCLLTITVSQLGALLLVLASKSEKNFFNSGELLVCSAVQLSGFFLCLMGAARITHRAQGIASVATRWHMLLTCASNTTPKAQIITAVDHRDHDHTPRPNSDHDHCIPICSQTPSSFHTRQALVSYLEHNNGGITLFGFALDRGLLHTLFAFESSLVLWILSKVVVLS